jgi:hypothetical protein
MKPFIVNEIFAVNEFDANKMIEHNIYGETIITYDNVFKFPHKVKDYLLESPAPRWKHLPGGKNFVEYWDCRQQHSLHQVLELYKIIDKIIYLTYSYSPISNYAPFTQTNIRSITSNLFQWKNRPSLTNIPDYFGNQPHPDGGDVQYAMTVGLNDEEDIEKNGIGFWELIHGTYIPTPETQDYLLPDNVEDGRSYYNECPERYWKIPPKFLKHDFNRVIVYPAGIFHGAYHSKLDFMDYPRITMVSFL